MGKWTKFTAGGAGTSVASLLGLLIATLAEVVGACVDDDGALLLYMSQRYYKGTGGLGQERVRQ